MVFLVHERAVAPTGSKQRSRLAFSLVELLVAMSLTGLLLVLTTQILQQTSGAVRLANGQRDNAEQARTALDRFSADISTAMLSGGATMIFNDATSSSDPTERGSQLGFICLSRTRGPSVSPRGSVVAYAVRETQTNVAGQTFSYGCLHRGDGEALYTGRMDTVFTELPSSTNPSTYEALGSGIVRFHVSFVLDDGSIAQVPPAYTTVSPTTDAPTSFLNGKPLQPGRIPVAILPENAPVAGDLKGRFVKALIVAVACLEPSVLIRASADQKEQIHSVLGVPSTGETPLAVWQARAKDFTFRPMLQSIRFYQRTILIR